MLPRHLDSRRFPRHLDIFRMTRIQRNLLALSIGLLMGGYMAAAFAANTGFLYGERCYATSDEARQAFIATAQSTWSLAFDSELCGGAHAPSIVGLSNHVSGATTGLQYRVGNTDVMTSCNTAPNRQFGLLPCDPETQGIAFSGTNALFLVLAFFYAAMLGFKTGYRA